MKYVKSFDGLRAISIFFVLLAHLGIYNIFQAGSFGMKRVWPLFAGETGVTIFFVLSGFLITRILLTEKQKTGKIRLKQFYIRRLLRLLPALLIFYCIVIVMMKAHWMESSKLSFLYSFFYLYNFVPNTIYIYELVHTWSLAVEEQFYFTWPFILAIFSSKKAFYVGLFLILLCIIAKIVLPQIQITMQGQVVPLTWYSRVNRWFFPAVAPIIIGSLTSIAISRRSPEKFLKNFRLSLICAFVLYLSPLYLPEFFLQFAYIFQAVGVALLLLLLFYNNESLLSRGLSIQPLVYIGKISYSIYIFQGLFLRTGEVSKLIIQTFPLNLALTFACAILSYHFVERPVLRFKEKFK